MGNKYSVMVDSGAFSIYAKMQKMSNKGDGYISSKEYKNYTKNYIEFYHRFKTPKTVFVSLDVIFNPEASFNAYKDFVSSGCSDVIPVIHGLTPLKYLEKYLKLGVSYIGIGGIGKKGFSKARWINWADSVFYEITDFNSKPLVKTHGFACTSFDILTRYPWYSVDSTTWLKAPAFGSLAIPKWQDGEFNFTSCVGLYCGTQNILNHGRNINKKELHYINLYLESVGISLESLMDSFSEKKTSVQMRWKFFLHLFSDVEIFLNKYGPSYVKHNTVHELV